MVSGRKKGNERGKKGEGGEDRERALLLMEQFLGYDYVFPPFKVL